MNNKCNSLTIHDAYTKKESFDIWTEVKQVDNLSEMKNYMIALFCH